MCILYSWCAKCNSKWLLDQGVWLRSRQKSLAHRKIIENRIAFEILSAVRLPWSDDAMVNLSIHMACNEQFYFRGVIYEHEHEQPVIYEECVTFNNAWLFFYVSLWP